MNPNKRIIPGYHKPNGFYRKVFFCPTCKRERERNWACGQSHDGEKGTWCPSCKKSGIKSVVEYVTRPEQTWVPPQTEIRCCGSWLRCSGFTNTCPCCGADYNWGGQLLAAREHWGEETGESLEEILSIP